MVASRVDHNSRDADAQKLGGVDRGRLYRAAPHRGMARGGNGVPSFSLHEERRVGCVRADWVRRSNGTQDLEGMLTAGFVPQIEGVQW